jgi:hypothetical protein
MYSTEKLIIENAQKNLARDFVFDTGRVGDVQEEDSQKDNRWRVCGACVVGATP